MIYIGELIKQEMQMQERSVSWLARKLGCTRAMVYRLYEKQSIDTVTLMQVSLVLHRNFFIEYSLEFDKKTLNDIRLI